MFSAQIKKGICEMLAWLLRMERPGCENLTCRKSSSRIKAKEMELRERSSKSLLANVLDLDDDFRHLNTLNNCYTNTSRLTAAAGGHAGGLAGGARPQGSSSPANSHRQESYSGRSDGRSDGGVQTPAAAPSTSESVGGGGHTAAYHTVLKDILRELRSVTEKMKKDDEMQDACGDWKFAAMVLDRLCLCLFTVFTVVSTFAILFSAPHILA